MNTRRVNTVANAICRAQSNGTVTPAGIAMALEGMGLLQSPESVSLSGPVCSQAEARAAGLDVAPSVAELTAMAESVVASGDPLSAGVDLARAVPLLGAEVERLRARIAELETELGLRPKPKPRDPRGCSACGSLPESWCPDCAACEKGCFGGFDGNECTHADARWYRPSVEVSADKPTALLAPVEDPHESPLHHDYRKGRDLPETGGAR